MLGMPPQRLCWLCCFAPQHSLPAVTMVHVPCSFTTFGTTSAANGRNLQQRNHGTRTGSDSTLVLQHVSCMTGSCSIVIGSRHSCAVLCSCQQAVSVLQKFALQGSCGMAFLMAASAAPCAWVEQQLRVHINEGHLHPQAAGDTTCVLHEHAHHWQHVLQAQECVKTLCSDQPSSLNPTVHA
jgi:hypothetical protein